VDKLVDLSVERLCEQDSPSLEAIKMQVGFDSSYVKLEDHVNADHEEYDRKMKQIQKDVLSVRPKGSSDFDALTGLYNRRYFFDYFEREMVRAKRYEHNVSIIVIDVDHFKNFNDKNGHVLGDVALKMVASQLTKNLRQSDVVARLGGEEFIVLLTETPKNDAVEVAEKLRKAIELEPIKGEESQAAGGR